jgi:FtsH-binding integral membrane protein
MESDDSVPFNIEDKRIFLRLLLTSFLLITGGIAALLVVYQPTTPLAIMTHTAFAVFSFISSLAGYIGMGRQMLHESASQKSIQLAIQSMEKPR